MTAVSETTDFRKVLRVGRRDVYGSGRLVDVFVRVEFERGRLSLSGVEGPRASGNAAGSAGQIVMGYAHRDPADNDRRYSEPVPAEAFEFAPGWDAETWLELVDVWERWHLNDMSPACEHQRELGWVEQARERLTLYHWRLGDDVRERVRAAEREAQAALRRGETVTLDADVRELATLPDRVTTDTDTAPSENYVPNGPVYSGDSYNRASEQKTRGWVRPSEHPAGLLTAPCPVCGYGYGTAHLREDVPADVLAFLLSLPEADKTPAWV